MMVEAVLRVSGDKDGQAMEESDRYDGRIWPTRWKNLTDTMEARAGNPIESLNNQKGG